MTTPINAMRVATAGLDLLHTTRLKLACSLLLADRIDVQLGPWPQHAADVVVLGLDSADGLAAWQALQGQPVRVLVVSRTPMAGAWIKHGATVRELNEHVRLLLSSPHATPVAEPALLLRHCRGEFGAGAVTQHAQLHVRVDPRNGCVQLPAGVALAEVIAALDRSGWHVVPDPAATALPQRISFEALFFALPEHLRQALPAVEPSHALQLRQWPELTAETSSPAQLLAIAHLHARPWRPQALANACKLPLQTVECLFAAALASGLAQTAEIPVPATQHRPDGGNTRFFSWVARRFGLSLFQAQS
ncbi:hypothetical protein QT199_008360 [Xanthomonas phaseoli pv. phaseoli]|uniref:Uncharacterized protein n=1 Tax=Xanthomonas campestris pv. phaseoli TaxID=317013 RepID=A0AB34QKZ5_XANCH|nr:hypothetical protein [Xanthomonas phaseoli]KHS38631.1 hypothetical protein RN20_06870 [Xanthomonas phaseoli pv. phaseoli]MDM4800112.1 hypothetical protein [Xanthomonas phaseoli pv. phaseoli]MDM4804014.1 hypothetical protein [Xanthomonas phaseoli pv. phaseoli]MDM4808149.1 hypothetical protein [Xanthomonas phaseoli pv. phaseoli]QWN23345.1 hypothetical protein DGM93_02265 [Xanthomonas phaseoli pv. phaseoli]